MEFLGLVQDNWFLLLQSLGIISGFFFTALALVIDIKVRRIGNLFEVTKQHREIWTALYSRPDLKRVVNASADITANPITDEEEMFVTFLILHLSSSYRAAKAGVFKLPGELKSDVAAFFALPIPRAVWEKTKSFQDPRLVHFVEECLRR
jgi:hypothetical protein